MDKTDEKVLAILLSDHKDGGNSGGEEVSLKSSQLLPTARKKRGGSLSRLWTTFLISANRLRRTLLPQRRGRIRVVAAGTILCAAASSYLYLFDSSLTRLIDPPLDHSSEAMESISPALWNRLADVAVDAPPRHSTKDIAVFWHILKAGGTTVHRVLGECWRVPEASEIGGKVGKSEETRLRVVHTDGNRVTVNVDVTTYAGLKRAGRMGMARSGWVSVMFTPLLIETATYTLDRRHKGRMFALFRHPVDRAVSQFYYLQTATWESTYNPRLANYTVDQYAYTPLVEENWMVRTLVDKVSSFDITTDDLDAAKEVLRKKCLVGFMDKMGESLERFRRYFGFTDPSNGWDNTDWKNCTDEYLKKGINSNAHGQLQEGDKAWNQLVLRNMFDMLLYQYALELYEDQESMFLPGGPYAE